MVELPGNFFREGDTPPDDFSTGNTSMIRLTWDLPADSKHVRLCRILVRTALEHMNVNRREVEELELTIGELCSNVVRHAEMAPGKSYQVELELLDEAAFITITDKGIGFEPELTEEPTPTESGGLGLWLVGQLMDKLEFGKRDGKGTVVHAERRLTPATPVAA
jgi:serine/threonine-protein kinase RsbW